MHTVCCIISIYYNLNSKGDFVADKAIYHQEKSCLATYTIEIKNNVFKTLPEQSKLEKAEASLKKLQERTKLKKIFI